MSRPVELADLADAILPDWCLYKAVAVLRAFFDESGIHADSGVTVICGFIGSRNQWRAVGRKWRAAMKGGVFHYQKMRLEGDLLEKLAGILRDSDLEVVAGGFTGNWGRAISSGAPDWPARFPSCYHMVFELCAQQMVRYSAEHWDNEPIALTFSRQDEYAKRVEEVWRTHKGNGRWEHLVQFGYGDPTQFVELQTADMIAHETYQCLKQGGEEAWNKWPLVRGLLECGRVHGRYLTEEQFVKSIRQQDINRQYLKSVEKPNFPKKA